jgi:hypothetical protein
VFFLAADVEAFVFRDLIVGSAFELVVAFGCNGVGKLFLKLIFCFSDFVLDFKIFLLALLLVLDFGLKQSFALLETGDSSVLALGYAGELLLLDNFLDVGQLLLDVRSDFIHFEGRDHCWLVDALDRELVELQNVNEVVFDLTLSPFGELLVPR